MQKLFKKVSSMMDSWTIFSLTKKLGENEKQLVAMVFHSIKNKTYEVEKAEYDEMTFSAGRYSVQKFSGSYKIVFKDKDLHIAINHPGMMDILSSNKYSILVYKESKNEIKDYTKYRSEVLNKLIASFLKKYSIECKASNEKKDLSFLK